MENSKSTQILIKQLTKENIKLRNRIRELERILHSSEKLTTIPAIHKIKTKDIVKQNKKYPTKPAQKTNSRTSLFSGAV